MEEEFNKYINSIELESLFIGDVQLIDVIKKVFNDAYLIAVNKSIEYIPFFDDTKDEDIWDEIYQKQLKQKQDVSNN